MAIVEEKKISSNSGFEKELDDAAVSMIIDNLQIFLYNKPIQACIKETVSNAIDSNKEKIIAKAILNGANVSDYYTEREGDIYKSSKFNIDYYDEKYLSDNNSVEIKYYNVDDSMARDQIMIEDHGVGLGDDRLFGFFTIGYSSKRLSSKFLGAFGLGCKSPLATGIDSYTLISNHNGKQFKFEVFSQKIDCVYSKWNEDGTKNDYIKYTTKDGKEFRAYYVNTTEKNGVKIIFDVKKHNKQEFFRAIRSQLQYIAEPIVFKEIFLDSEGKEVDETYIKVKNEIIYETDDIILGKDDYYTKPHFVINNVVYNVIDFPELELPERRGNVGIKVSVEEVDLPPSRENIVYTPRTKAVVIEKMHKVSEAASVYINDRIKSDVPFEQWNDTYVDMVNNSNSVINRLNSLIDDGKTGASYQGFVFRKNSSSPYGKFTIVDRPYELWNGKITNSYITGMIKFHDRKLYAVHQNMMSDQAIKVIANVISKERDRDSQSFTVYLNNTVQVIKDIVQREDLSIKDDFQVNTPNDIKENLTPIFEDIYQGTITTTAELIQRLYELGDNYIIFKDDMVKYMFVMGLSGIIRANKDYINNLSESSVDEVVVVPKIKKKPVAGTFNAEFIQKSSTSDWKNTTIKFNRSDIGTPAFPNNVYYIEEGNIFHEEILLSLKSRNSDHIFASERTPSTTINGYSNIFTIKNFAVARVSKSRIKWVNKNWTCIENLFFDFPAPDTIRLTTIGSKYLHKVVIENKLLEYGSSFKDCIIRESIFKQRFSKVRDIIEKLQVIHKIPINLFKKCDVFSNVVALYFKEKDNFTYGSSTINKFEHSNNDIDKEAGCVAEYQKKFRVLMSDLILSNIEDDTVTSTIVAAIENIVNDTIYLKDYYVYNSTNSAKEEVEDFENDDSEEELF